MAIPDNATIYFQEKYLRSMTNINVQYTRHAIFFISRAIFAANSVELFNNTNNFLRTSFPPFFLRSQRGLNPLWKEGIA
mgnify:CR=1 FL=1